MNTTNISTVFSHRLRAGLFALAAGGLLWVAGPRASAATYTVNPLSGATGVSRSAPVVFTFSQEMNTDVAVTSFSFLQLGGIPQFLPANVVWNPAGTVATVRPASLPSLWPDNVLIQWILLGETLDGSDTFEDFGTFTTGGSSSGGTGTNAVTSFSVGVYHGFLQTNPSAPVLDPEFGYFFQAGTLLASNRTADAVTVMPPLLAPLILTRSQFAPEMFSYFDQTNDLAAFNANYPGGAYQFTVTAAVSNQLITVNLPAPTLQPNAPRVTNYDAAQAVNPAQPFTLSWDPFVGGTANDFIVVEVGTDFKTPETPGQGRLNGTATSVVIPANTLRPNSNYTATIYFERLAFASNGTTSVTSAARATTTDFALKTTGPTSARPVLTNSTAIESGKLQFQVTATAGQTLFVESSVTLLSNSWSTVYTTNAVGPLTIIALPMTPPGRQFFRIRTN